MEDKRQTLLAQYRSIFSTTEGRAVLEDLKNFCKYDKALYSKGAQASVNEMLVNEGQRIVYLHIIKILKQAEVVL